MKRFTWNQVLVFNLGFDTVDLGPLSESWRTERDTPAYVRRTTAAELREITENTARVQQA